MVKDIKGYEGLYGVDETGQVHSLMTTSSRRKGIVKAHLKNGYLAVNLYKDGKVKHFYIHRLIAETFLPNEFNYKEVNHIDCDKLNNRVENLEWCDRKSNLKHAYSNGLKRTGEKHGMHKLTLDEVVEIKNLLGKIPQVEIARMFDISQATISAIKCGRIWKGGDVLC